MDKRDLEGLKIIGEGKCATIYRNGNMVYKILKENSDSRSFYSKEMLQKLIGIKNDLCVFPNEILEDENGELLGYSMDFVSGSKLKDVIAMLSFEQIESVIKKAEQGVQEVSEQGILFDDLHDDNVMWNDETQNIQIIDTDFFRKVDDISNLNETNYSRFANAIQNMINSRISQYGRTENEELIPFYDFWTNFNSKNDKSISLNDYILNLKVVIERDFGRKFNNLSEIEMALQEKQEKIEEQQHLEQLSNNLTIKEKFIRFLVQSKYIRKLPIINRIIDRQIKMLLSDVREVIINTNNDISTENFQKTGILLEGQDTNERVEEEQQQLNEEDKEEKIESQHKQQTLLDSAIVATEKATRTGKINEQVQDAKRVQQEKIQQQDKRVDRS